MYANNEQVCPRAAGICFSWKFPLWCLLGVLFTAWSPAEGRWADTFYQYRIPIELKTEQTGWQQIPLSAAQITAAVNGIEELEFDPMFFAYNHLKVVGESGDVLDDAGFYLVPVSEELMTESLTGEDQTIEIPTEKGEYYLVSYLAAGSETTPYHTGPAIRYEQTFPIGSKDRHHAYLSSYTPRILPRKRMTHEALLRSDGQPMTLVAKDVFVAGVEQISVKKVRLIFLADIQKVGKQRLSLYYQPLTGYYLTIPQFRRSGIPHQSASVQIIKAAQRYDGATRSTLVSNQSCEVWFAETTVKLTPKTTAPKIQSQRIRIACAKNESQSFQLVVRPKRQLALTGIRVGDLNDGSSRISSDFVSVQAVEYVPIRKPSNFTPIRYLGLIGDPLVPVASAELSPERGNQIYWVTVQVAPEVAAGTYKGTVKILFKDRTPLAVPIHLVVYDFELPEYSGLQASLGADFFQRRYEDDDKIILDYHGLSTKPHLSHLAEEYYEVMAANRFYPRSVAAYGGEIDFKWSAPPEGYNVDAPGNHFRLYDWDFTAFNRRLRRFVDELKVNSICLAHTNPQVCNVFRKLPDIKVAWGPREGDAYQNSTEITRDQFDHLVLDYYRAVAEHLNQNGWLNFAYIIVDETMDIERILHYCKLMKSDPLTSRIKLVACMQGFEYFWHKEDPSDSTYTFNGLLTHMPQMDENYNRWEPHYFSDYGIAANQGRHWNYAVYTNRLIIDTPGINNRITAMDLYRKGASGWLVWETFWWDHEALASNSPWNDPGTNWGNGTLSHFYPPRRDGLAEDPDYHIVPSLRIEAYREGAEDYDYAEILERLMLQAQGNGLDLMQAKSVRNDIDRFFCSPVLWSQNDAWFLELRERMAAAIMDLKRRLN